MKLNAEQFQDLIAQLSKHNARDVLVEVVTSQRFASQTSDDVTHTPVGLKREGADSIAVVGFCVVSLVYNAEMEWDDANGKVIRNAFSALKRRHE